MFIHINNMNFSLVAPSRARKKIIEKQRMELMKKAAETKPFLLLDNRVQVNDTDSEFFSCSSVRLTAIVEYVNNRHMLPDIIDSSRQYKWYKNDEKDITFDYFKHYDEVSVVVPIANFPVTFYERNAENVGKSDKKSEKFSEYKLINFDMITKYICKYFLPSIEVMKQLTCIENLYKIDYNNSLVVFYNEPVDTQTQMETYKMYLLQVEELIKQNSGLQVLVNSVDNGFLEYMREKMRVDCVYLDNELECMVGLKEPCKVDNKEIFSKKCLAVVMLMSKCKYIVCSSDECSLWTMYYRGNSTNVYQRLENKWVLPDYRENITYSKEEDE